MDHTDSKLSILEVIYVCVCIYTHTHTHTHTHTSNVKFSQLQLLAIILGKLAKIIKPNQR
jgi:hypothetical protein